MSPQVRGYDGSPNYIKGGPEAKKRDAVKITHRKTVKAFREIGEQALNLADFERTAHLPVGRGRLACDPETGEFDQDSIRAPYDPRAHSEYPRHVHSTITEGESKIVENRDEHELALATRKWSDKPLEKKKRFALTQEDQMQNFKGELQAERARGLQLERRVEELLGGGPEEEAKENSTLLAIQLQEEREARLILEARMEQLMMRMEAHTTPAQDAPEDEPAKVARRGR